MMIPGSYQDKGKERSILRGRDLRGREERKKMGMRILNDVDSLQNIDWKVNRAH